MLSDMTSTLLIFVYVTYAFDFLGPHPRGYSHTVPIGLCAAQRGCDFGASDLERSIHFRDVPLKQGIIF